MNLRKQERLTIKESFSDMEHLNQGARKYGLPLLNEITNYKDIEALKQLLEQENEYKPFEITDEIEMGQAKLAALKKKEIKKDPIEIHYQREIMKKIQETARLRFGLDFPDIPVERIIYVSPDAFYDLYTRKNIFGEPMNKEKTNKTKGFYDIDNRIVIVKFLPDGNISERMHTITHELTHNLLYNQKNQTDIPNGFREFFKEGVTEQAALEIDAEILIHPDLIEFTKEWIRNINLKDPSAPKYDNSQNILSGIPSLIKITTTPTDNDLFACYSYPVERMFICALTKKFKKLCRQKKFTTELEELETDPLKIFVRYVAGKDRAIVHKLMRAAMGKQKFEKLKEQHSVPSDEMWKLI